MAQSGRSTHRPILRNIAAKFFLEALNEWGVVKFLGGLARPPVGLVPTQDLQFF